MTSRVEVCCQKLIIPVLGSNVEGVVEEKRGCTREEGRCLLITPLQPWDLKPQYTYDLRFYRSLIGVVDRLAIPKYPIEEIEWGYAESELKCLKSLGKQKEGLPAVYDLYIERLNRRTQRGFKFSVPAAIEVMARRFKVLTGQNIPV